jgi:hypothetical protein
MLPYTPGNATEDYRRALIIMGGQPTILWHAFWSKIQGNGQKLAFYPVSRAIPTRLQTLFNCFLSSASSRSRGASAGPRR